MNITNRPRNLVGHGRNVALATALLLPIGAVACASDSTTGTTTPLATTTAPQHDSTSVADQDAPLTQDELAGLLWMREEEQLAHDVYTALGDMWGLRIFENIASSERTHIDAALDVLDQYDLADPAADNEFGTFTNPQIQDLHDQLMTDGSASLTAALEVGALVEELDISDLRASAAATDNADLTTLYAQLERGSRNHLRAFTSQLELRDVVYEPTQLNAAAYEEIVTSPTERGRDA